MGKYLSVLFTLIFIYSDCQAMCPAGFFGSWCQYKCHCAEKCDDSGACIGQQPSCAKGWFGLGCQYEDIAVNAELLLNGALSSTKLQAQCVNIGNIKTLTLSWSTSQVFTWMRIQTLDTDILKNFTVTFYSGGRTLACAEQKILQMDKNKYNIYCQMNVAITQITLSGEAVKSICSVHVNGGRNLALKQQTSQTSTHLKYESQFAVDGIVAPSCRFSNCSHTAVYDTTPSWSVMFDQAYLFNRFVLYNRLDSSTFRLKYFGLQVLDEKHSVIFNYTDTNHSNNQSVYTVLYPDNKPAAIVTVVQTHMNDILDAVPYVSLNEFEAYGGNVYVYFCIRFQNINNK
uniref:Fucolectin tachylectin-4 pentraxin-1 domain-containing protein n=1 Tax=Biomphalaria glabrata TaxID=6526 RepID=A0A2C9KTG8_BIOGL